MNFLKYPLWPFSLIYTGITQVRNLLYDKKALKSVKFNLPVINVGNLTVGGTGKTPHVEYLVRLLRPKKIAILSRGYKRKTTGFIVAGPQASATSIGDEPYQYYCQFPEVTIAVCEDRVMGVNKIVSVKPQTEIIILDDAYQHRAVVPLLNILITDYNRLFFRDWVLPAGRLRESKSGASRADVVIVSKCPGQLNQVEAEKIKGAVSEYSRMGVPVYFTTYKYGEMVGFGLPKPLGCNIILVTGIAQSEFLYQHVLDSGYTIHKHFNFPDHYAYTKQDVQEISNFAALLKLPDLGIITTQKDWTKLSSPELVNKLNHLPLYYLPIEVAFLRDEAAFNRIILNTVLNKHTIT